jgi:hypothetical protein
VKSLTVITNPKVDEIFDNYPDKIRAKMIFLRQLVLTTAEETEIVKELEETIKWGEPSFTTKFGSTLRMDWKEKFPNQYALYFQCTSRLVETFKMVFGSKFNYEGNRAIVFQLEQEIPMPELQKCIKATLIYHKVKHMITLGI